MSNLELQSTALRPLLPARDAPPSKNPSTLDVGASSSRVMLVDFRSGEAVNLHPDLCPLLQQGWTVKSAVPRLVEGEGLKLLVVLNRGRSVLAS